MGRWQDVLDVDRALSRLRWWQARARARLMHEQRAQLRSIRAATGREWLQTFVDTSGAIVNLPPGRVIDIDAPIVILGNQLRSVRVIDGGGSEIRVLDR